MAGLLNSLGRGLDRIPGLLFPGYGVNQDPQAARQAQAQAMMQMGAGLLGGANFGQAYGAGSVAGGNVLENVQRQALFERVQGKERRDEEAARRQQEREMKAREIAAPFIAKGDYQGARDALMQAGYWQQAEIPAKYAEKPSRDKFFGTINPGQFTPQSLSKAAALYEQGRPESEVYGELVERYAPESPIYVNTPGYGAGLVNPWTGRPVAQFTTPQQETDAAAGRAGAVAESSTLATKAAERAAAVEKKLSETQDIDSVLDIATPLIHVATGSGVGAAADKVASLFGVALDGAQAVASLRLLQANLMLKMPRMEGPQSDRDVKLYEQAAAQLGDPMVPRATKMAAVRTIRQLHAQYRNVNQQQSAPPGNRLRFDDQGNLIQ